MFLSQSQDLLLRPISFRSIASSESPVSMTEAVMAASFPRAFEKAESGTLFRAAGAKASRNLATTALPSHSQVMLSLTYAPWAKSTRRPNFS